MESRWRLKGSLSGNILTCRGGDLRRSLLITYCRGPGRADSDSDSEAGHRLTASVSEPPEPRLARAWWYPLAPGSRRPPGRAAWVRRSHGDCDHDSLTVPRTVTLAARRSFGVNFGPTVTQAKPPAGVPWHRPPAGPLAPARRRAAAARLSPCRAPGLPPSVAVQADCLPGAGPGSHCHDCCHWHGAVVGPGTVTGSAVT